MSLRFALAVQSVVPTTPLGRRALRGGSEKASLHRSDTDAMRTVSHRLELDRNVKAGSLLTTSSFHQDSSCGLNLVGQPSERQCLRCVQRAIHSERAPCVLCTVGSISRTSTSWITSTVTFSSHKVRTILYWASRSIPGCRSSTEGNKSSQDQDFEGLAAK